MIDQMIQATEDFLGLGARHPLRLPAIALDHGLDLPEGFAPGNLGLAGVERRNRGCDGHDGLR